MRRRAGGRRCGARGRETNAPPLPGGAGHRPGALRPPARSSLTAIGSAGRGLKSPARQEPEPKARPGAVRKTPPWSAERRPRFPATEARI